MDLIDKIKELSKKITQQKDSIKTEEATKTAFVLPFIHQILGYDVFNPNEVIPEFIADIGKKKGEKVDYAIKINDKLVMIFECKTIDDTLDKFKAIQLQRYFTATEVKIAVLTNGIIYKFFSDLDEPNKMDSKPFMELNLLNIDENIVAELKKLTKTNFQLDTMLSTANELKYTREIKKAIANEFNNPSEKFVKFICKDIYSKKMTSSAVAKFTKLVQKACNQFIAEKVNERLKSALEETDYNEDEAQEKEPKEEPKSPEIITTEEEIGGFYIIKSILRDVVPTDRIKYKDTLSYFGIMIDNLKKQFCRLKVEKQHKYIYIVDKDRNWTKYEITSIDDIYLYSDKLKEIAKYFSD